MDKKIIIAILLLLVIAGGTYYAFGSTIQAYATNSGIVDIYFKDPPPERVDYDYITMKVVQLVWVGKGGNGETNVTVTRDVNVEITVSKEGIEVQAFNDMLISNGTYQKIQILLGDVKVYDSNDELIATHNRYTLHIKLVPAATINTVEQYDLHIDVNYNITGHSIHATASIEEKS